MIKKYLDCVLSRYVSERNTTILIKKDTDIPSDILTSFGENVIFFDNAEEIQENLCPFMRNRTIVLLDENDFSFFADRACECQ